MATQNEKTNHQYHLWRRMSCFSCEKKSAPSRCASCSTALYCDAVCQRQDWKFHKVFCHRSAEDTEWCLSNLVDVLIATGNKNTTRFERWEREPGTEDPAVHLIKRELGSLTALGLSDFADAYGCRDSSGCEENKSARMLLPIIDMFPPERVFGPVVVYFRDGICRQGKTALELARLWFSAYISDDFARMRLLAQSTPADNRRRANRAVKEATNILGLSCVLLDPVFVESSKEAAAEDEMQKWKNVVYS
jgi:hypothetical protein